MATWKRLILVSFSFGAGFAIVVALLLGGIYWYSTRPKPWNKNAITATYDGIDTEGKEKTLVFEYVLKNNTATDYEASGRPGIFVLAKLDKQESLSGSKGDDNPLTLDFPIFIPAKQSLFVKVHVRHPSYAFKEKRPDLNASSEELKDYEKKLANFVSERLGNLAGFVIFDEYKHYQIYLPNGWTQK